MAYRNKGYEVPLGMSQQSAFRTAVAVTDKVPYIDESLSFEYQRLVDDSITGNAGISLDDQGGKIVQGGFNCYLRYDQLDSGEFVGTDLPLAIAMGTATWNTAQTNNQITLNNDIAEYATIALLKGDTGTANTLWEFIGCASKGFTIEGDSASGMVKAMFDWLCYNVKTSSCTNTATDITSLPSVTANRLLFRHMTFRWATDYTDALAAADKESISSFSLNVNHNLSDAEFASTENSGHTDSGLIYQPERSGFRECTLNFTLPRYDADTLISAFTANSPIQADFTFTDGTNSLWIYIPYLVITKVNVPVSGPDTLPVNVECRLLRGTDYNNGAGNTVMLMQNGSTTIDEEFAIETSNERTAVILS